MKTPELSVVKQTSQRWWGIFPFLLALLTLVFIGWTASQPWLYLKDGIESMQPTGLITEIESDGPSANKLFPGDQILSVDGVRWNEAEGVYNHKRVGDPVKFVILRNGETLSITIFLAEYSPTGILNNLIPLFVALVFWAVGVGVLTYKPPDGAAMTFILWSQVGAIILTSGTASYLGPIWASSIFNFLLWIIGPLSVHLHLRFPQFTSIQRHRLIMWTNYALGFIGGMPYLLVGPRTIRSFSFFSEYLLASRLFLGTNLLLVVFLLIHAYKHVTTSGVRSKIRIVALGSALSSVLLVTLTILPDALLKQTFLPYSFAFLLLSVIPLTYGYAIFRYRLIEIEKHVNRGATLVLLYGLLGAFYLVIYALLHNFLPQGFINEPLINTLLVLLLASIFQPLQRSIQRIVDTVFYGGWYDYRSAVTQITQELEQISSLQTLAETVCERLVNTLHLEESCIFLRDLEGDFSVIAVSPKPKLHEPPKFEYTALPRSSLSYLLTIGAIERVTLRNALSQVTLTPEENQLLNSEQVNLWVPIIGHGQIQGLMALGPKFGGDIFSSEDLDILRVVARQIGPVIENIHLLTQLREYAAELEQRVIKRTAELHDAKERVEAILASVGDGVVVTDLDGEILTVNKAFIDQSEYTADELIGQKFFDLLLEQNDPALFEDLLSSLKDGRVWSGELVMRSKSGSSYDIQLTLAPVRDQSGQIVSYVGSQRDITKKKELERLKDMFVADVSHELRTPTSNISLYLELLEDAPPEKRPQYLSVISEQSQLLKKLVEDILDLSRLTIGKSKKIEFTAVDLNRLTMDVVQTHIPMAEASGLALKFDPSENLRPARGEPNQLGRLITNLVSNSLRYTFKGHVHIRTFQEDTMVGLEIQDTGIGIEPDDLPHLFERFYRGRQVRQTAIHGTGLGLAIVKEIIDTHEGSISVRSQVGSGSTFTIRIPMLKG